MSDSAWPFLVSRNRLLGYQTVVGPGFLVDARAAGVLADNVEPEPPDGTRQERVCTHVAKTPEGPITLIYRTERARLNGETLRDGAGRPVLRMTGVVLRGRRNAYAVGDDVLDKAEGLVDAKFRAFWEAREPVAPARSESIEDSDKEPSQPPTPTGHRDPVAVRPRNRITLTRRGLCVVLTLAFVIGALVAAGVGYRLVVEPAQQHTTVATPDIPDDRPNW